MINTLDSTIKTTMPDKKTVAFNRYADEVLTDEFKEKLQFPMGKEFEIIDSGKELFRV